MIHNNIYFTNKWLLSVNDFVFDNLHLYVDDLDVQFAMSTSGQRW